MENTDLAVNKKEQIEKTDWRKKIIKNNRKKLRKKERREWNKNTKKLILNGNKNRNKGKSQDIYVFKRLLL